MSNARKILLGILSIMPLLLIILYCLFFFGIIMAGVHESDHVAGPPTFILKSMGAMFVLIALAIICTLGLLIYYIVHVMNNPQLDNTERLVWIIVLVFTHSIGFPIYWYLKIWKAPAAG